MEDVVDDEVSEERHLVRSESIASIRQGFNYLTELWLLEGITSEEYRNKLEEFAWFDEEGQPWIISPENGNWYRLTESGSVLGEPPDTLYRPIEFEEKEAEPEERPGSKFCAHCGSPFRQGTRFCAKCGKPV